MDPCYLKPTLVPPATSNYADTAQYRASSSTVSSTVQQLYCRTRKHKCDPCHFATGFKM